MIGVQVRKDHQIDFISAEFASGRRVVCSDAELIERRDLVGNPPAGGFVLSSERGTPLSKHNVWLRNMRPRLQAVGLEWCNFQVMRWTHSTLMKAIKADPKLVADQMGRTLDVNQNIYTQGAGRTSPASRERFGEIGTVVGK